MRTRLRIEMTFTDGLDQGLSAEEIAAAVVDSLSDHRWSKVPFAIRYVEEIDNQIDIFACQDEPIKVEVVP